MATQALSRLQRDRLKPEALAVKIEGRHIGEISAMSIARRSTGSRRAEASTAGNIARSPARSSRRSASASASCRRRPRLPDAVARAGTLSGGESQRIRLASQIGSGLTGVMYVLDEPSIGLHQRDNAGC